MTASPAVSFSALVVGEGPMPMQCAHILRRAGHRLVGLVTPDAAVRAWAEKQGIATLAPADDLAGFAREHAYDYLFSIVNYAVLPDAVLRSARVAAVNYHDGPLPRYAGVYVTSWALMNGESRHGVTWHRMVEEVDAGDILKQVEVPIADTDTATSLNRRCYDAGIKAFIDLVTELGEGRAAGRAQDLSQRTYFGLKRRPPAGALLDWARPAAELDRLVRALSFGAQPNPLAVPKVALPSAIFAISSLAIEPASGATSGTLLARTDDGFRVATATDDVVVRGLSTVEGVPRTSEEALAGAVVGQPLPALGRDAVAALDALAERVSLAERWWQARLAQLPRVAAEPPATPALEAWPEGRIEAAHALDAATWAAALTDAVRDGDGRAVLGVATRELRTLIDAGGALAPSVFATVVPLHLASRDADVAAELAALSKRGTFARDLLSRYPVLRAPRPLAPGDWSRVSLLLDGAADVAAHVPTGTGLVACVVDGGRALEWRVDARTVTGAEARRVRDAAAARVAALI